MEAAIHDLYIKFGLLLVKCLDLPLQKLGERFTDQMTLYNA